MRRAIVVCLLVAAAGCAAKLPPSAAGRHGTQVPGLHRARRAPRRGNTCRGRAPHGGLGLAAGRRSSRRRAELRRRAQAVGVVLSGGSRARLRGAGEQEARRTRCCTSIARWWSIRDTRRRSAAAPRRCSHWGRRRRRCRASTPRSRPIRRSQCCAPASTCCVSAASSRTSRPRAGWRSPASWTPRAARTSPRSRLRPTAPSCTASSPTSNGAPDAWMRPSIMRRGQRRSSPTNREPTCSSGRSTKRRATWRKPPRNSAPPWRCSRTRP